MRSRVAGNRLTPGSGLNDQWSNAMDRRNGLIVVDLNNGGLFFDEASVLTRQSVEEWRYYQHERDNRVLPRTATVLAHFRRTGAPVVFLSFSYQCPGGLDLDPKLKEELDCHDRWWAIPSSNSHGGKIPEQIAPLEHEPVLCKTSWGAFGSSNLPFVVQNLRLTDLWFCGAITSGCVRATATQAGTAGYRIHAIRDCCLDWSDRVHQSALRDTGYLQAISADELTKGSYLV
jgi:nicotinamidase-related amidase